MSLTLGTWIEASSLQNICY